MRMRNNVRHDRHGGVLVVALLAVMAVSVLGAGFLRVTSAVMSRHEAAIDTKQAFYLAEAGLAESWAGVLLGKSGVVGSENVPAKMGDGIFWVEATDNPDGTRTLASTGLCGSGRATLEIVVGWPDTIASADTILTDEPLVIPEGALIDTYEPPAEGSGGPGGIGPAASGEEAESPAPVRLASNGSITVEGSPTSPATVLGDLAPGPGESATVDGDSTLSGGIFPAPEPVTLPPVDVPNVTLGEGVVHGGAVPYAVPTGTSGYDHLVVEGSSQVIVTGPAVVVLGDLTVEPRGELVLDASLGEIELYVTRSVALQRGASVTTTADDPTQLSVQIDGDVPVQLDALSQFHGMLHAPQARLAVGAGFELFGSLVARGVDLAPGVRMHFDERVWAEAQGSIMPRFIGWRVKELPQNVRTGIGRDAFTSMGLDPQNLPGPYQAHRDQTIDIEYVDLSLVPQSYSGPENGFDWNDVLDVTSIARDGAKTARRVVHDDSNTSRDGTFVVHR